jgi:hypothetical protein
MHAMSCSEDTTPIASCVSCCNFTSSFKPQYFRNHTAGVKNLKCFPVCRNFGHTDRNFCGGAVTLSLKSALPPSHLLAVGVFSPDQTPFFPVGTRTSHSELRAHALQKEKLFVGNVTAEGSQPTADATVNNFKIEFNVRGNEKGSWQYNWASHKSKADTKHSFQACIFAVEGGFLRCIHVADSPSFVVSCTRRRSTPNAQNKRKLDSTSHPSAHTLRRQWVHRMIAEKGVQVSDVIVENVSDASKWKACIGGFHPPCGIRNWTLEAGHFDAFFQFVKDVHGVDTPSFSRRKKTCVRSDADAVAALEQLESSDSGSDTQSESRHTPPQSPVQHFFAQSDMAPGGMPADSLCTFVPASRAPFASAEKLMANAQQQRQQAVQPQPQQAAMTVLQPLMQLAEIAGFA